MRTYQGDREAYDKILPNQSGVCCPWLKKRKFPKA
jgi:hypothetical protein